jgi:DNA-binding transcriptional LysR family regulator
VDFGIVAFPVRRTSLTIVPWRTEKLVLACAPGHRLARRRSVRLAELAGQPFIAFERDIPTRKTIDRVLRSHRVPVDTVMEFDNVETIKRSVEVGTGIAILPATTVTTESRSGMLAIADFAEGPFTREVGIIHRRGRVLSAPAQTFIRLLVGLPQAR